MTTLERDLLQEFDVDELEMTSESTPNVSGYLEVTVDGKLIHSKKNGDGYIDSAKKLKKITDAIHSRLTAN